MSLLYSKIKQFLKHSLGGRSQDGREIGRGDHFLPHKFIKRSFERRANTTKQLNTGRTPGTQKGSPLSSKGGGSVVKNLLASAEDMCLILGSGRSSGEGNSNPLQYSCLENLMDRGAWWATDHGITKSRSWLRDYTTKKIICLTKRIGLR
ncbi:hypothetical protein R6Z07M_000551 [Ovis aries]